MLEALVTGDLGHSLCVVTRDRGGSTEVAVAGWRLRSNSLLMSHSLNRVRFLFGRSNRAPSAIRNRQVASPLFLFLGPRLWHEGRG